MSDDDLQHGRRTVADWVMNFCILVVVGIAALAIYCLLYY